MTRFVLTSHAVDRWRERVDPSATFAEASDALTALMTSATRVGATARGEVVYALQHDARPVAVVRHRDRLRRTDDTAVVVTILDAEQWTRSGDFDPMAELMEAYEDLQTRRAPPPTWTPRKPTAVAERHTKAIVLASKPVADLSVMERDQLWVRMLAAIEAERRRVANFEAEVSGGSAAFEALGRVAEHLRRGQVAEALAVAEAGLTTGTTSETA